MVGGRVDGRWPSPASSRPGKKKKKKDATSARATLGRPVGWRGRPHGRHPAAGQGLSGASASSLLQQRPPPSPQLRLKSINIRRVYLFLSRSAFSLFSGVGEERSVTLQKTTGRVFVGHRVYMGGEGRRTG